MNNEILDELDRVERSQLPEHDCHLSPEDGCEICDDYYYGNS